MADKGVTKAQAARNTALADLEKVKGLRDTARQELVVLRANYDSKVKTRALAIETTVSKEDVDRARDERAELEEKVYGLDLAVKEAEATARAAAEALEQAEEDAAEAQWDAESDELEKLAGTIEKDFLELELKLGRAKDLKRSLERTTRQRPGLHVLRERLWHIRLDRANWLRPQGIEEKPWYELVLQAAYRVRED